MVELPEFDVAIVGGGPAGAACAILCAQAGLRTLILEKSAFPRDKVCGDCINPGCWPLFKELGVTEEVLAAPHMSISRVAFIGAKARRITFPLDGGQPGEIALPRRILDAILLRRSARAGADVCEEVTVRELSRTPAAIWHITAGERSFTAKLLVAADGRNSTVARLLGSAPPARRDRVGLQTHVSIPGGSRKEIEMHLFADGYCGVAPIGGDLTNFCMVATPARLDALKSAVCARFAIPSTQEWRAIAPLERAPIGPLGDGVVYVGDAARVVEPFTGEGIYYALHTASVAARHIIAGSLHHYPAAHAALYRRRLWINGLARWAVTHPDAGAALLRMMSALPTSLHFLVRRVTASRNWDSRPFLSKRMAWK